MAQRTRLSYFYQPSSSSLSNVTNRTRQVDLNSSTTPKYHTGVNSLGGFYQVSYRVPLNLPDIKGQFSYAYIQQPSNVQLWGGVHDWVIDVNLPTRDYDNKDSNAGLTSQAGKAGPETQGFGISMATEGNDIVIPQGRGQFSSSSGYSKAKAFSIDYGSTFVNVHNGLDAVVGGQGRDHFVSQSMGFKEAYSLYQNKFVGAKPVVVTGSKFFVGGSYDDLLAGGVDADLLIGDRFNNYELYLNKAALSKNIPARFEGLKNRLLSYQPDSWNGIGNKSTENYPGTMISITTGFGDKLDQEYNRVNQLWVPGNDVIHGYSGDDIIYGDNNIGDNYYIYKMLKDSNWMGRKRIGDDFLDGGPGNDIIFGGIGTDAIIGGTGSDIISAGDLIIAPGYDPLFGPKVVWGGQYNKAGVSPEPDLFVVGNLFDDEAQIDASRSGVEEIARNIEDSKKNFDKLSKLWEGTKFVLTTASDTLALIGDIVSGVKDLVSSDNAEEPKVKPRPIDAVTLIKDFDKSDIVVFKVPSGADVKCSNGEGGKGNLQSDSLFIKNNPLLGVDNNYNGTGISYSATAGQQFNRIILDGYNDKLFVLGSVESPASDGVYKILGGAAYADISVGWAVAS